LKPTTSKKFLTVTLCALSLIGSELMLQSCSTTPQHESTGQYVDSSVITTKVKSKLLADNMIKSFPITVNTYKNVVQLSGFVNTNVQAERAIAIAQSVPGVTSVKNSLLIKNH
jgi:hyperosmotically inducible protein